MTRGSGRDGAGSAAAARAEGDITPPREGDARHYGPAFPNDAAFFLRFMLPVGSMTDETGRPLHEVDFRDEIPTTEYSPSRFSDSRGGYLINNVAFRQMASVWDDILAIARALGGREQDDPNGPNEEALARLWRSCLAAMFLPVYLIGRPGSPLFAQPLPIRFGALFKVVLDLPTTLDLLLIDGGRVMRDGRASDEALAESIIDFADKEGILLNGRYACAGPQRLMMQLICAFLRGDPGDLDETTVPGIEPENYRYFCDLMSAQYVVGYWFGLAYGLSSDALHRLDPAAREEPLPSFPEAYERRRRFALVRLKKRPDLASALDRYQALFSRSCAPAAALVGTYFDALRSLTLGGTDPALLRADQAGLERLTNEALASCQRLIEDRFGIDFGPKLGVGEIRDRAGREPSQGRVT
jgi:hypothetical protein